MMAFRLNASFSYGTDVRREGKVCMCVVTMDVVVVVVGSGQEEAGERSDRK